VSDTATLEPATKLNKKVVVHIVSGRLSGMRKIIGHLVMGEEEIPAQFQNTTEGDVQHAGTFPRYVLYRQFNPAAKGRLNDFHPEQR
jgi:hypothetical protein